MNTSTNQASELDKAIMIGFLYGIQSDLLPEDEVVHRMVAFSHTKGYKEALAIIRTEKLKLLDRISSHQEDLFWWTGGEYEKTKAVDMRAIAAERELLTKLEAEL